MKLRRSFRGSEDPAEPFLVASLEGIGDTKAPRRLHTYGRSFRPALASLVSVKRADRMATCSVTRRDRVRNTFVARKTCAPGIISQL